MTTERTVAFDAYPESAFRYLDYDAVVCIDVLRTTTTMVSALASGRRVFVASDWKEAQRVATPLTAPLFADGSDERAGSPATAESDSTIEDSPAKLSARDDVHRPLVIFEGEGARLIANARSARRVFVSCFRNLRATVAAIEGYRKVAILTACEKGRLRCDDLMAAAWMIRALNGRGFQNADMRAADVTRRWAEASIDLIRWGSSAERLLLSGRGEDVEYVVGHVNDVEWSATMSENEAVCEPAGARAPIEAADGEDYPRRVVTSSGWRSAASG